LRQVAANALAAAARLRLPPSPVRQHGGGTIAATRRYLQRKAWPLSCWARTAFGAARRARRHGIFFLYKRAKALERLLENLDLSRGYHIKSLKETACAKAKESSAPCAIKSKGRRLGEGHKERAGKMTEAEENISLWGREQATLKWASTAACAADQNGEMAGMQIDQ